MASRAIKVTVRSDMDRVISKFRVADPKPAVARALNKTITTCRAKASQAIRAAGYNIKAGDIKAAMSISRASGAVLIARITASGRPIPLGKYGARQTGKGTSVRVKNGTKLIPGAFIATMPSGHKGVFVRVGSAAHTNLKALGMFKQPKGARRKAQYKHGLPIDELFGPSIPSAFINEVVTQQLITTARDRFPVVLAQELNYLQLKGR